MIENVTNKSNKLSQDTVCAFTNKPAQDRHGQLNDGTTVAVPPPSDQSSRSVTEGSSSANSASMLAV